MQLAKQGLFKPTYEKASLDALSARVGLTVKKYKKTAVLVIDGSSAITRNAIAEKIKQNTPNSDRILIELAVTPEELIETAHKRLQTPEDSFVIKTPPEEIEEKVKFYEPFNPQEETDWTHYLKVSRSAIINEPQLNSHPKLNSTLADYFQP